MEPQNPQNPPPSGNNTWSAGPPPVQAGPPPPLPPVYQAPYQAPPPRKGTPVWVWILAGCGGSSLFFMLMMAAILFPVFAKAREKARQSSCAVNLKQQSLAMLMYAQDYDGKLPQADAWMDNIEIYQRSDSRIRYLCPSATTRIPDGTNYAFDNRLATQVAPQDDTAQHTLLIYDSTAVNRNAADPGISLPAPGRHSGGNNIAFADGHVKWVQDGKLSNVLTSPPAAPNTP